MLSYTPSTYALTSDNPRHYLIPSFPLVERAHVWPYLLQRQCTNLEQSYANATAENGVLRSVVEVGSEIGVEWGEVCVCVSV